MQLVLTEDQQMLAKSARELVSRGSSLARIRALRDDPDPAALGYARALWTDMAALGWAGIPFAEELGGLGLGLAEVAVVAEELGRGLMPEPFLTSLLAGDLLARAGAEAQRAAWLPGIIDGGRVVALALEERTTRNDPSRVALGAEAVADGGFRLSGEKTQVVDGFGADALIVVARTSGAPSDVDGLTMFLLDDLAAPGLTVERQRRIDSRNAALVTFDGVALGADAVLGDVDAAAAPLDAAIERAGVALAAEMLGTMSEAFERTLAYLKERVQFGVVIGSFQGLKHRAARVYMEIELARSAVMAAARAADAGDAEAGSLACVAQARCSDAIVLVMNEAVQMFGGIGMTDEHDIGFFLKRARVAEMTFGDAAHHRDRFAQLHGF